MFQIEHLEGRKANPARKDDYTNVTYACAFCNRKRGKTSKHDVTRGTLLNPFDAVMASHFFTKNGYLQPMPDDGDAQYTEETYGINRRSQLKLRNARAVAVESALRGYRAAKTDSVTVLRLTKATGDRAGYATLATLAEIRAKAYRTLAMLQGQPDDPPPSCTCGDATNHVIPAAIAKQLVDFP